MKYKIVACGGTFDYFHKGHESFLRYVFSLGENVLIGITSDKYIRSSKLKVLPRRQAGQSSKLQLKVQNFKERVGEVSEFLKKEGVDKRVEIVEIKDLFGPTLDKDLHIDAIVASDETKKGAEIINKKRNELGLQELKVFLVPDVLAEDGQIISSSRIRNGEIDRDGKLYIRPFWLQQTLILPKDLRNKLRNPLGSLLDFNVSKDYSQFRNKLVVTVGDVTAKKFNDLNIGQKMSVVDFRVKREEKFANIKELGFDGNEKIINIDNPAGSVSADLFAKIIEFFKSKDEKTVLQIKGEEDLAVLPIVLAAPLGTIIFYGQPNEGLVKVEVTEESKSKVYCLIEQFELKT